MAPAQNSPNGMARAENEPSEAVSKRDSRANDQPRPNSNPNGTPANMGGQQDITASMQFASNSGTSFYTPYTNLNSPGGEPAHESRGGPHHAQGHFHYGHGDAEQLVLHSIKS
ncbi:hypothetical protein PEBR_23178 [Penicillium brasilianum]|uniref:Uncharacterized protein n=1 Tax=Penicillium brasilianum TaxID=104259 RepID=A0A1S9RK96_PENBI|nr:hypothetical protein PEBR_23178 [Penicillium brasilianum]